MQSSISCRVLAFWFLTLSLAGVKQLTAGVTYPIRPAPGTFVQDEAELVTGADKAEIQDISQSLQASGRPIIVVTIYSLSAHGAAGVPIETYARGLFDDWGIGSRERSYGILLLVSVVDQTARIELGEGWAHTRDDDANRIMNEIIMPEFQVRAFSAGIVKGVAALSNFGPDGVGNVPSPWRAIGLSVVAIVFFLTVSLIRSGDRGWGWGMLAYIHGRFVQMRANRGNRSYTDDDWGSGGDSGGGHSGGGGATGHW